MALEQSADGSCQITQNSAENSIERDLQLSSDKVGHDGTTDTTDDEDESELEVSLTKDEIDRMRSHWTSSLIVKLHGKGYEYQHNTVNELKAIWRPVGEMKCVGLGHGFFVVSLDWEEDLARVSDEAPWFIGDTIITVRKWEPNFKPSKSTLFLSCPTWIRLLELPIEYHDALVLEKIGNRIGSFLRIDNRTAEGESGGFARLCVQVNLQNPLRRSIKIGSLQQPIQYEGINLICPTCRLVGHEAETCPATSKQPGLKHRHPANQHEMPLQLLPSTAKSDDKSCSGESRSHKQVEEEPTASSSLQILPSSLVRQGKPNWMYEVFVCFRGEDTRKGFASHLFDALARAEIYYFQDTDEGERGSMVSPMLTAAIRHSRIALVLISPNFADSRWCLDELVEIMDCNNKYKDHGHVVFPIFYNVAPSDVRGLRGAFGNSYQKCVEKNPNQKAAAWRRALEQVGSLSGWEANEDESTLVKKIVETIRSRVFFDRSPYGGDNGDPFDDKICTGIRKITIVVVSSTIESIRIDYDQNGSMIRSPRYGGAIAREGQTFVVRLNYPKEYITSISGYIRGNSIHGVIQSLSIQSNEKLFGPYGKPEGRYFSIVAKEGDSIAGFMGRSGSHLNSIGAYTRLISNPFSKMGPSGTLGHINWDDGYHQNIRQIVVEFDSKIRRISIVYDNYGHPVGPFMHGKKSTGSRAHLIDLAYPDEYLTSISGYTTESIESVTLQSLTFHTNVRNYGPYGTEVGSYFSDIKDGVKIVGFYGRYSSGDLQWIGANVELLSDIYPLKRVGLFGGDGGNQWDDGNYTGLRRIVIKWDSYIHSVSFAYDKEGQIVKASRHGGAGGAGDCTVNLDADEYIIRMCGYYDRCDTGDIVKSLTFESNKRMLGPYGNKGGTYFLSQLNFGKLVGFYGRSSEYLDSIGAYFAPISHIHPLKKIGPFGSDDGESWDDGRFTDVRAIEINCVGVVDSIGFVYDDNGEPSQQVARHGGKGGTRHKVVLDYPNEYIVSMTGYIGSYEDYYIVVRSITFQTNCNKYGPFGTRDEGIPFSFGTNIGKFVGFFGSCDRFLNSIGAYVELLPSNGASSHENGVSSQKDEFL